MADIREYRESDFEAVLSLLNRNTIYDSFSDHLLEEKLYKDPNWDMHLTQVAEKDGILIGFMQGVARNVRGTDIGYIKLMAVDDNYRRQGIATRMYREIESRFLARGIHLVRIYDVPLNYFMPGIDPRYTAAVCFAERMGFRKTGEACNMRVNLGERDWDTAEAIHALGADGIAITRAKKDDLPGILELLKKEWELWEHEVRTAMTMNPPALFIAKKEGRIRAFSAYDGNNVGTGWFGPMGTDPSLRGKGIGSILLYLCLQAMRDQGHHTSVIPWVEPVAFYSHYANAYIDRVFWRYEKKLSG